MWLMRGDAWWHREMVGSRPRERVDRLAASVAPALVCQRGGGEYRWATGDGCRAGWDGTGFACGVTSAARSSRMQGGY